MAELIRNIRIQLLYLIAVLMKTLTKSPINKPLPSEYLAKDSLCFIGRGIFIMGKCSKCGIGEMIMEDKIYLTYPPTYKYLCSECGHFEMMRDEIVKSKRRKDVVIGKIKHILIGIDKCEDEHPDGWWQASPGAEFGARKLDAIERYLNDVLDDDKVTEQQG